MANRESDMTKITKEEQDDIGRIIQTLPDEDAVKMMLFIIKIYPDYVETSAYVQFCVRFKHIYVGDLGLGDKLFEHFKKLPECSKE